ncbi:Plug domain-containing protein, partial [Kozakia baliensis]
MARQTAAYARNTITRDYIASQSPTTNVLNLVRNTPGVVVASADPTGATDRMSISIRGMNQNEIGYEFEGMNPSDVLYYSPASSSWADTENIGSITVSPGSPDLMSPTFSAVGGLITAKMRSPSAK